MQCANETVASVGRHPVTGLDPASRYTVAVRAAETQEEMEAATQPLPFITLLGLAELLSKVLMEKFSSKTNKRMSKN